MKIWKKIRSTKILKKRKSWKKRTRGNCEAEASQQKKKPQFRGAFWKCSGHNSPFNPWFQDLDPSTLYSFSRRIACLRPQIHIIEFWTFIFRPQREVGPGGRHVRTHRIKDQGPCFGTNEHPRRDTDVILRLSKSTIEDLSFYIGFVKELMLFDETMTFLWCLCFFNTLSDWLFWSADHVRTF